MLRCPWIEASNSNRAADVVMLCQVGSPWALDSTYRFYLKEDRTRISKPTLVCYHGLFRTQINHNVVGMSEVEMMCSGVRLVSFPWVAVQGLLSLASSFQLALKICWLMRAAL